MISQSVPTKLTQAAKPQPHSPGQCDYVPASRGTVVLGSRFTFRVGCGCDQSMVVRESRISHRGWGILGDLVELSRTNMLMKILSKVATKGS